jgi:hypothetical protein
MIRKSGYRFSERVMLKKKSMIRTRRAALAQSEYRFFLGTNAKRLPGDDAQMRIREYDNGRP